MEYTLGQRLNWTPIYFKCDKPAEVEVVKLYRRGYACLSNGYIVDGDGVAEWHKRLAGSVSDSPLAGSMEKRDD